MRTILLLGDSLTQTAFEGWAGQLAHVYQRRADIINRGCSGYNTSFYLHQELPQLSNVCLVTIFFGANDAALADQNPHHHVSLKDYEANLSTLIERVQTQYNHPSILLITPPPLDHAQRLAYQKQRYGDLATGVLERTTETTKLYAQACQKVAKTHQLPCLDLFTAFLEQPQYSRYLSDGLHFSVDGHTFVGQQVVQAIGSHFPTLAVQPDSVTGQYNNSGSVCEGLPNWGPYHDHIDRMKLKESFSNCK